MDATEVAELLGVTPWIVQDWARRRAIPVVKLGRNWRFVRSQVEAWVLAQGNRRERLRCPTVSTAGGTPSPSSPHAHLRE